MLTDREFDSLKEFALLDGLEVGGDTAAYASDEELMEDLDSEPLWMHTMQYDIRQWFDFEEMIREDYPHATPEDIDELHDSWEEGYSEAFIDEMKDRGLPGYGD